MYAYLFIISLCIYISPYNRPFTFVDKTAPLDREERSLHLQMWDF